MNWLGKLKLGLLALLGYIYKFLVDIHILRVPFLNSNRCADVIVSLTCYGRRIKTNVVYYTLVSILRQSVQPSRVILWISEKDWNDDLLPAKLLRLKGKGVEIKYCKDVRSYTKLIHSLKLGENTPIVTVDDDIIYSKDTLETLMKGYNSNPSDIICLLARKPIVVNGLPQEYEKWEEFSYSYQGKEVIPMGYGGVLYPPASLDNDVCDEDIFLKLCPLADDIWFWVSGLKKQTMKHVVAKKGVDLSFDSLYQYFHKGSALTHTNRFEHQNDKQIRDLFRYYNIIFNDNGTLDAV